MQIVLLPPRGLVEDEDIEDGGKVTNGIGMNIVHILNVFKRLRSYVHVYMCPDRKIVHHGNWRR